MCLSFFSLSLIAKEKVSVGLEEGNLNFIVK